MTAALANPLLATPARALPRSVAIIGAGTIGPDIGYYLKSALPGLKLFLVDVSQKAVDSALLRFEEYSKKAVARGKMSEADAAAVTSNLVGTLDYADIAGCDWVIEAATENLALKRKIFAQVEAAVRPDADHVEHQLAAGGAHLRRLEAPGQRATVTHFFAPAWRNPAVEVIAWEKTDPAVVEYLRWVFCITGKVPLVTADVACFMLDRIFDNWCNEAALLLDRATAAEIDSVAAEFVHAGPFFVLNLARGNPIIVETNTLQADEEGEHYRPGADLPLGRHLGHGAARQEGRRRGGHGGGDPRPPARHPVLATRRHPRPQDRRAADLDLGCRSRSASRRARSN
jgi:enoyl-CoA hydratase/3-hydroxyacyl-CoA dehydrogenase